MNNNNCASLARRNFLNMKYRLALLLFCLYLFSTEVLCGGSGGGGRSSGGFSSGKSSGAKGFLGTPPKNNIKQPVGTNGGDRSAKVAKTGGSIFTSTWGIIALITFVITGTSIGYYVTIFYPLICAKRGKYDVMEMTTV